MDGFFLTLLFFLLQCSCCKTGGGIIPVAYSPDLGVQSQQFTSQYLANVLIHPDQFKWPSNSTAGVYRVAVGDFDYYFGLNTTEENVAYLITGKLPPRRTNTSSWLRIAPYLPDLAPIAKEIAEQSLETEERVFISDASLECRELRELTSPSFKWSVLTSDNSSLLGDELYQLKSYVNGKTVHYALCDGNVASTFSEQVLTKLLETGLYFGSEIYVYTKRNMTDNGTQEVFKSFAGAGASLTIVSPVLCGCKSAPVEASLKALEQLSMKSVSDSVIQLGGQLVPFNSANFLRLMQTSVIEVSICNRKNFTICFTKDGFLCIVDVNIYGIGPDSASLPSSGFYDHRTGQLTLLPNIYHRPVVKLLAFQDTTFLPSLKDSKFSMAMQMIQEIFNTKVTYGYEIVPVTYSKDVVVQKVVEDYLSRSDVTMAMSAFPLPLYTDTKVRHTEAVLYDGIVMIKSRRTSKLALFHIFDSLSGFIWLCVFASLIFVAIIFFTIKVVYDNQTRSMGVVPEDENTPLFKRFLTVIFQNFSAVLLAKEVLRDEQSRPPRHFACVWICGEFSWVGFARHVSKLRYLLGQTLTMAKRQWFSTAGLSLVTLLFLSHNTSQKLDQLLFLRGDASKTEADVTAGAVPVLLDGLNPHRGNVRGVSGGAAFCGARHHGALRLPLRSPRKHGQLSLDFPP
ncbi:hypothetical protein TSMEX_001521 [Taenia solium]|eukprot:TsM_000277100 transcript=TsM_000277100 gene=TsM_000277100